MRNYLKIAGKDSRDFGVYISGQGTFSAPEKAYEFYGVPGRNGAILGNDHRLENIEVTYQCFIYNDFNKNIADFRTFLLSLNGYQRLEDSYHPDEYRMAVYAGPFEPEVTAMNNAGSFELIFNCKPQRYLTSGETVYTFVQGSPQAIKGQSVEAWSPKLDTSVLRVTESVETVGSSDPFNPRLPIGNSINIVEVIIDNHTYGGMQIQPQNVVTEVYIDYVAGTGEIRRRNDIALPTSGWAVDYTYSNYYIVYKAPVTTFNKAYTCSHFKVFDVSSSAELRSAMELGGYVYGCYYKNGYMYIAGELDDGIFDTVTTINNFMSTAGAVVDGELVTPQSFTFTGFTPDFTRYTSGWITVRGYWSGFIVELQYVTDSDVMSNPTMFPSSPLIRVNAAGSFTMDGVTVTVTDCNDYVDIDCELMDCYEGSINRNKDVTFSTYDFPKLQPGGNKVEVLSGITVLQMTPRWWRV